MNNTQEHQQLVDDILFALGSTDLCRVWPARVGLATPIGTTRKVYYGLKGESDIEGILRDGRRLHIEVKTGTGRLTQDQKNFRAMIEKFNGIYIEARCLDDALYGVRIALGIAA